MSDPLADLITDIQNNGVRWVSIIALLSLIRKERRNHLLNERDKALFHNQKIIMEALGRSELWKDGPRLGFRPMVLPSLKQLYSLSRKARIPQKRRMNMLTNLFKTSLSKKLIALLLGAAVAALNKKLGLDLTPDELLTFLIVVGGYILGQSHVDAKKITAGIKDSPLLQMGFTEAIPILQEIHTDINKILNDVKKNDNSQAFKDAMKAYAQIKPILDALKHPEPVMTILDEQVAS